MWQKLSLRARLNTAAGAGSHAGPRHQHHAAGAGGRAPRSGRRPKRDPAGPRIHRDIGRRPERNPDPDARLDQIIQDLNRLRHVSITRQDDAASRARRGRRCRSDDEPSSVPAWFVALVHPEKTAVNVPISIHGKPGSLVITSHPDDEMNEIWDGIVTQLLVGSAIAVDAVPDHDAGGQPRAGAAFSRFRRR